MGVHSPFFHSPWLTPSSDNITENNVLVDTGNEATEQTILFKQGEVERIVRRDVVRFRLRPPKNFHFSRGKWQIVDASGDVYIYSAFYDSRPNLDWPHVRVTAVAEIDVHMYKLCCLLWYQSQRLPDVAQISLVEVGAKFSPRGQKVFGQYILSCRVDKNRTGPPTSVSVVPPHTLRVHNMLPIEVPEQTHEIIEFGMCVKILYLKQDVIRMVEWLEAHRMWGVGEINVYATQIDNITDSILARYSETGFVKYRESPGPLGDHNKDAIRLSMSAVINDCMYRNLYRYRYVLSMDLDEMIVPASPYRHYSEMLKAADAAAASSNAIVHSYSFRNTYFFLDFAPTETEPWYLLTNRYRTRIRPSRFGYASKSVTRTLSCIGLQNHYCWQSLPIYANQPNWNVDVPAEIGKNHHYKKCHFDDYLQKKGTCREIMSSNVTKDNAILRFKEELSQRVANKLLELGLAETGDNDR